MSRALDRAFELQPPTVQPPPGKHITVIICYDGQEWVAANGVVEEIEMTNEIDTFDDGSPYLQQKPTGRKTLAITVRPK